MESKYYTPIIEEFYVGFEYEYKNHDGTIKDISTIDWKKGRVYSINDLVYIERGLKAAKNTRIKYLDSSDLESFGWKQSKLPWQFHNDNSEFYFFIPEGSTNFEILGKDIICISSKRYDDTIFRGKIKNKSELQQVLKMIGVIE